MPGRYEVELRFTDENGFIIPAEGSMPELEYPYASLGGAVLDEETGIWAIDEATLYSSNKIKFYFLKVDTPESIEELQEMSLISNYSKRYRKFIEPEFIS